MMPETVFASLRSLLEAERLLELARALAALTLGLALARLAARGVDRAMSRRLSAQHTMLLRRTVGWLVGGLGAITALRHLGLDLSALLGAAGLFTVALGVASQTAASNLISGLFLLADRPFVVGELITVGPRTGTVVSIGLLSVKLRTAENLLVRIPNETLIKSEVVNASHFPIRRVDLALEVHPGVLDAGLEAALLAVPVDHPACLAEPAPQLTWRALSQTRVDLTLEVWCAAADVARVRADLVAAAHALLRARA